MSKRSCMPFRLSDIGLPLSWSGHVEHCVDQLREEGVPAKAMRRLFTDMVKRPQGYLKHPILGSIAAMLCAQASRSGTQAGRKRRTQPAPWSAWGENLDPQAISQMENGCMLPVAVAGALMPDAHVGYGLPIGGVLAVDNAVIPYGVGMDIACRMKMSVFAVPVDMLDNAADQLAVCLEQGTCFGVGGQFRPRKDHSVMHEDWGFSPVIKKMRDTAWAQLGTSGSGNHFVEWGVLDVPAPLASLEPGQYLALLSHSGSRGTGGEVAKYYSALARKLHPELPTKLGHLAWLNLDTEAGQEYWAAMELMGRYSAANHQLIHAEQARLLGAAPVWTVENHHNFAWVETHNKRTVIVHRKGATPAGAGVLGIIPGTMVDPAYVVEGLGNPHALCSAAHGAGRMMSRQEAKKRFRRHDIDYVLHKHGVRLLSAGLDEAPMAYKNIRDVMAAQTDLVRTRGMFLPRIVKMAR